MSITEVTSVVAVIISGVSLFQSAKAVRISKKNSIFFGNVTANNNGGSGIAINESDN